MTAAEMSDLLRTVDNLNPGYTSNDPDLSANLRKESVDLYGEITHPEFRQRKEVIPKKQG